MKVGDFTAAQAQNKPRLSQKHGGISAWDLLVTHLSDQGAEEAVANHTNTRDLTQGELSSNVYKRHNWIDIHMIFYLSTYNNSVYFSKAHLPDTEQDVSSTITP